MTTDVSVQEVVEGKASYELGWRVLSDKNNKIGSVK